LIVQKSLKKWLEMSGYRVKLYPSILLSGKDKVEVLQMHHLHNLYFNHKSK